MNLEFHEAARGCQKVARVNVVDVCPKCQGTCCLPGTKMIRCDHCNATGMVNFGNFFSIKYILV